MLYEVITHPPSFECEGLPARMTLAPGEWRELRYQARPLARGEGFGAHVGRMTGPVWVTQDGGENWDNVTPRGLPPGGRVRNNFV